MNNNILVERKLHLAERIVIVDGLPGCGKTMLSPIIAALDRVELLTYAYEIEYICALNYLHKIAHDGAETMIRMLTDLQLYNTMLSRETNFRWADLSSVFADGRPLKYIKRIFQKGEEAAVNRIKREKPILNLTTHNLLAFSEPIFNALENRVIIIELVRHPLYMLKQQALNMERLLSDVRHFTIHFNYRNSELPYWAFNWEELFVNSNPMEKAIFSIKHLTERCNLAKKKLPSERIITVPFEKFVLDPWPYMKQFEKALENRVTSYTRKVMKKQKVPREMYADSINLKVYKRYAWEPPKFRSEEEEFALRRQFAAERVSDNAMQVLDKLCLDYENRYLNKKVVKGSYSE